MIERLPSSGSDRQQRRAQSHVVGVALMLGLAVIALGSLTMGIATLVDSQTASADADRVAADLDRAIQGADRTGHHSYQIHFSDGHLQTEQRTLRILENGTVLDIREIDALVYENDDHRVTALAGAVIRERGSHPSLYAEPSITSSDRSDVLLVSAPVLNATDVSIGGQGGIRRSIETNVSHSRTDLGDGEFAVAIETASPEPFEQYFEEHGIETDTQTFPGDSRESIVATYPETEHAYLVTHDLELEVTH